MKRLIVTLVCLLLFSQSALAEERSYKWTTDDVLLQATYSTLHYTDWKLTREFTGNPHKYPDMHEGNPILGEHPSARRVNLYMASTMLLHVGITAAMPHEYRSCWLAWTIIIEGTTVQHARSSGVVLTLGW